MSDLITYCFNEHLKDIGGEVSFTLDQYRSFWEQYKPENNYQMKNRDGSFVNCKVAYYPLPYYKDLRALIEIPMNEGTDFREVPVHFLQLNNTNVN